MRRRRMAFPITPRTAETRVGNFKDRDTSDADRHVLEILRVFIYIHRGTYTWNRTEREREVSRSSDLYRDVDRSPFSATRRSSRAGENRVNPVGVSFRTQNSDMPLAKRVAESDIWGILRPFVESISHLEIVWCYKLISFDFKS